MKNLYYISLTLLFFSNTHTAQSTRGIFGTTNWTENWTNYKPKSTNYRDADFILNGDIKTDTKLSRKNCYLLTGIVVIKANATLTIEAGTIIRGDFATSGALIVEAGAKIIAEGTETDPIIFTSSKAASDRNAGDWGGISILGNAPINKLGGLNSIKLNENHFYGGTDSTHNSGVLKYIRIEFAGKKINNKHSFNALTLAAVGSETIIENIQTSFSKTTGFNFLGGNTKVTKLVSFKNYLHDFAFNEGTNTRISNSIAFRFPNYSDASLSNALEIRSYDDMTLCDFSKKPTTIKAINLTIISTDDLHQGNTREAIFVAENTNFTFSKSVVQGFSPAIILDKGIEIEKLNNIVVQNVLFNKCKNAIVLNKSDFLANLNDLYAAENFLNEFKSMDISELLQVPDFKSNSNFMLKPTKENNVVTN